MYWVIIVSVWGILPIIIIIPPTYPGIHLGSTDFPGQGKVDRQLNPDRTVGVAEFKYPPALHSCIYEDPVLSPSLGPLKTQKGHLKVKIPTERKPLHGNWWHHNIHTRQPKLLPVQTLFWTLKGANQLCNLNIHLRYQPVHQISISHPESEFK